MTVATAPAAALEEKGRRQCAFICCCYYWEGFFRFYLSEFSFPLWLAKFSVGDAYEQVMGRDRTGIVRGIGTGPTPKSLWGSRSEQKLRQDNESLKEKIDALEERMKKIESCGNNEDSLAGRRVRILNFSGEVVASGILMSDDNDNVVMGKKLGGEYYEVSILIAHDPIASLFIKDADRKNMNDAVGSHIIWFREYLDSLKDSSSTSSFPAVEVDQKADGIEDLGADEIAKEIRNVKRQTNITHGLLSVMIILTAI
ncbi:hypothetical protein Taro_030739 [Colocasia esculenta]|uniref:Uncharacterized protein n=1 Tax=Colocasia esculenta TaxID=4460 RepID=A0A843VX00_COLES|nr:hypothetical protein [Colocasia esculenta]